MIVATASAGAATAIDREALVRRHHPVNTAFDPLSPFTVGNGGFAMTVDVTGLQSFPEAYAGGIPLSTQSNWGWHSLPNENGYQIEDTFEHFATGARMVPYPTKQTSAAGAWLRSNPHRLGLGLIGFEFLRDDGTVATREDIADIRQELSLWTGEILSSYTVNGVPVVVTTVAQPQLAVDAIAFRVKSDLLRQGRLRIVATFPYGSEAWGIDPHDWSQPERHSTEIIDHWTSGGEVLRSLDDLKYGVRFESYTQDGQLPPMSLRQEGAHRLVWSFDSADSTAETTAAMGDVSFAVVYGHRWISRRSVAALEESPEHWRRFWTTGAAVDFAGSTDPRAAELERRVVLSQYLTAIQCAGDMPPQETGLTANSWFGVPHLEMHWWHGVHFAQWNRFELLERSLPWYEEILPTARGIAARQGYAGARWPKMVDREGREKPSGIAPLLIWQQPHPITFAELAWRESPTPDTLERYREIVFETATFMADFARLNPATGHYDLGPPLIPAQESYNPRTTKNPPYELAYWRWGLATAQAWRERLGLAREPHWDEILAKLAPYPHHEDAYATAEGVWNMVDHPSVLGALGMLPGPGIDRERMRRILHRIMAEQDWDHTWGWDYPLIALTAARLGEPALAVDALLLDRPKNTYLPNGHNYQDDRLRLYLPGNGALLTAVALMSGGWDGAPDRPAPGFPDDGSWVVRSEGLRPLP